MINVLHVIAIDNYHIRSGVICNTGRSDFGTHTAGSHIGRRSFCHA